jgi:hypothetical protein
MGLKKYYYVLEDEGRPTPTLEFDSQPAKPDDLAKYIGNLLSNGPVLFYGTTEQAAALSQSGLEPMLHVDETTDSEILRTLDQ